MAPTNLQQRTHALQVGVAINPPIDLKAYCPQGTSFAPVRSSRVYPAAGLLPPGLTLSTDGILSGTPTASGATACTIRAYRGTRNPDLSWAARRAGAYNSERFDADPTVNRGNTRIAYDTGVKRSGAGSLRIFKNAGDSHAAGVYGQWYWSTRVPQSPVVNPNSGLNNCFSSNAGFGPGEEFWIQFSFRPDDNYCRVDWPPDPKIAMLDMLPWLTNLNLGPTANDWEIVTTNRSGGIFRYFNSPAGPGWSEFGTFSGTQGFDKNENPGQLNLARTLNGDSPGLPSNAGATWSAYQQERAKRGGLGSYRGASWPDGRPDPVQMFGTGWAVDQWHTVLLHVKNGSGTPTPNPTPVPDGGSSGSWAWANPGLIEVFIAHEGQDYIPVFSATPRFNVTPNRTVSPFYDRSGTQTNGQDTTWSGLNLICLVFNNALTGLPLTRTWYDELICSPALIPAPDFDGTSNYRTSDAIVTFKVAP